jgi:hypothetical protein
MTANHFGFAMFQRFLVAATFAYLAFVQDILVKQIVGRCFATVCTQIQDARFRKITQNNPALVSLDMSRLDSAASACLESSDNTSKLILVLNINNTTEDHNM